jgi:hypothetical protein
MAKPYRQGHQHHGLQLCHETQVNVSASEMWTALQSDRVPSVHPLRAWLNHLPEYTPEQPDWIDFVAQQVNEIAKTIRTSGQHDNQF